MGTGRNQNSFTESLANLFTPNDGYSYSGGTLKKDTSEGRGMGADYTAGPYATNYGYFGQADSAGTGTNYQNVTSGGEARDTGPGYTTPTRIDPPPEAKNTGPMYTNPLIMGTIGAFSGGLPGLLLGAGSAQIRNNMYGVPQIVDPKATELKGDAAIRATVGEAMGPGKMTTAGMGEGTSLFGGRRGPDGYTSDIRTAGEPHDRIRGAFYKRDAKGNVDYNKAFKINTFGNSYEIDTEGQNIGNSSQIRRDAEAAMMPDDGGIAMVRSPAPITPATVPTNGLPAASAESIFARQQIESPPVEWLIANGYPDTNPSYEAIRKYNTDRRNGVASMAEGGDVEFALGGNEKDLINAAERAVRNGLQAQGMARGDELNLSDEDKIAIAQYVQQYGEDALRDLVDSVRTGSAQETRDRFARGDNGYVNGNGDGSGTDDKVPAKLKEGDSEQDVLLATKEFVLKESAATALEDAGISLDKINDAGPNAAAALKKYMTA